MGSVHGQTNNDKKARSRFVRLSQSFLYIVAFESDIGWKDSRQLPHAPSYANAGWAAYCSNVSLERCSFFLQGTHINFHRKYLEERMSLVNILPRFDPIAYFRPQVSNSQVIILNLRARGLLTFFFSVWQCQEIGMSPPSISTNHLILTLLCYSG